jgi:hypothetical protein
MESVHGLDSATVGFGDDPRRNLEKKKEENQIVKPRATQQIEDQAPGQRLQVSGAITKSLPMKVIPVL